MFEIFKLLGAPRRVPRHFVKGGGLNERPEVVSVIGMSRWLVQCLCLLRFLRLFDQEFSRIPRAGSGQWLQNPQTTYLHCVFPTLR